MAVEDSEAEAADRIAALKLYGERNTGTRALAEAIAANIEVPMMRPSARGRIATLDAAVQERAGFFTRAFPHLRQRVREAVVDEASRPFVASGFGWKHAAPPVDVILADARAAATLFVVVTKHPLFFLKSLHRRPHHDVLLRWPKPSLSRFLRQPWQPVERDLIGSGRLASPVDLWTAKARAYRMLLDAAPHTLHVRYEDFVADYAGTLDRVADALGRRRRPWTRPDLSTKGDPLGFEDYAGRYRLEDAARGFSSADIAFLATRLPANLVASFGYSLPA
jgi:hypothetical protein